MGRAAAPGRRAIRSAVTRRWVDGRGAAMVEFAFILPVLMAMLLGTVTGGIAYHEKIAMADAVREGARFGATLTDGTGFATSVRDRTEQLSAGELGHDDVCVQLVRAGSPDTVVRSYYPTSGGGSCPASFGSAPPTPSMPGGYCVVKVWAHRTADLQAFFFTKAVDLKAKAVAAYERGATAGVC
ncbi:MAG: TadE/TadG family type IV pilus assembly protein [Gaiellales bacterium]